MSVTTSWHGGELALRNRRAAGRAAVSIAEHVSAETKRLTHRVHGTLARSVHAAPVGYDGSGDERLAEGGIDLGVQPVVATPTPTGAAVEVGSWLPYACVEWVGRGHPGVTQGLESVRGSRIDAIVKRAYEEEGLA